MEIIIIAAVAKNRVIGKEGKLPWHLPEDFRHFKRSTEGHAVIMGRTTFASIGKPLPNRVNIVLSTTMAPPADGSYLVAASLGKAIAICLERGFPKAFIIGGARLYREALEAEVVDTMILSELHDAHEGDALFPEWDAELWREDARESFDAFDAVTYRRT